MKDKLSPKQQLEALIKQDDAAGIEGFFGESESRPKYLEENTSQSCRPTHLAAELNHLASLKVLIKARAKAKKLSLKNAAKQVNDHNGAYSYGYSTVSWQIIHFAAKAGALDVMNYLLSLGIDVDTSIHWSDYRGANTPVSVANYNLQETMVHLLVQAGAKLTCNDSGVYPFEHHGQYGDTINTLKQSAQRLRSAIQQGHAETVTDFAKQNIDWLRIPLTSVKHEKRGLNSRPTRQDTALHYAAADNQPEMLDLIATHLATAENSSKATVLETDGYNGWPLLFVAIESNATNSVQYLVDAGVRLDEECNFNRTHIWSTQNTKRGPALNFAAYKNNPEVINILLAVPGMLVKHTTKYHSYNQVEPATYDTYHFSASHCTRMVTHHFTTKVYAYQVATQNDKANYIAQRRLELECAIIKGDLATVTTFAEQNSDWLTIYLCNGSRSIDTAARHNQVVVLDFIVSDLAKHNTQTIEEVVNTVNHHGRTALHYAALANAIEAAGQLLTYQADPNITNRQQHHKLAALHFCLRSASRSLPMVQLLVGAGGNVDAEDSNQQTPLSLASDAKDKAIVDYLLRAGAKLPDDMDIHGKDKWSYLKTQREKLKTALRSGGTDVVHAFATQNIHWLTTSLGKKKVEAIHYACACGQTEVMSVIMQYLSRHFDVRKANILSRAKIKGKTPLYYAISHSQVSAARFCLQHGADIRTPVQFYGYTLSLLDEASATNHDEMIDFVLSADAQLPLDYFTKHRKIEGILTEGCYLLKLFRQLRADLRDNDIDAVIAKFYQHPNWLRIHFNQQRQNALHLSARYGHNNMTVRIAMSLAKSNNTPYAKEVDLADGLGMTPLDYLALHQDEDTFLRLAALSPKLHNISKAEHQQAYTATKIALNAKLIAMPVGGIAEFIRWCPEAVSLLSNQQLRAKILTGKDLLTLIKANEEVTPYLFDDPRIRDIIKGDHSLILDIICALPLSQFDTQQAHIAKWIRLTQYTGLQKTKAKVSSTFRLQFTSEHSGQFFTEALKASPDNYPLALRIAWVHHHQLFQQETKLNLAEKYYRFAINTDHHLKTKIRALVGLFHLRLGQHKMSLDTSKLHKELVTLSQQYLSKNPDDKEFSAIHDDATILYAKIIYPPDAHEENSI